VDYQRLKARYTLIENVGIVEHRYSFVFAHSFLIDSKKNPTQLYRVGHLSLGIRIGCCQSLCLSFVIPPMESGVVDYPQLLISSRCVSVWIETAAHLFPKNKKGVPRQMQSRLRPCSNLSKNLQVKKSGDAISMAGENVHPLGSNSPTCAEAQTLVSPIPIRTSPDFLTAPKEPIPKSFSGVLPEFLRSFSGSFPGGSPDNFPVHFHTHGSQSGLLSVKRRGEKGIGQEKDQRFTARLG
jgi:hypothetical protein